jgi:rubrerythrin
MKQATQFTTEVRLSPKQEHEQAAHDSQKWTKGICPNCGFTNADVDEDDILWCPACGYSKKGCYT